MKTRYSSALLICVLDVYAAPSWTKKTALKFSTGQNGTSTSTRLQHKSPVPKYEDFMSFLASPLRDPSLPYGRPSPRLCNVSIPSPIKMSIGMPEFSNKPAPRACSAPSSPEDNIKRKVSLPLHLLDKQAKQVFHLCLGLSFALAFGESLPLS